MPKWVYPLSFLFLLFLIYNDPAGAGDMAHAFAEFVGAIFNTFGQFLSGLFGDPGSTTSTGGTNPSLSNPTVTVPASPTTDVFGHGHTHGYHGG